MDIADDVGKRDADNLAIGNRVAEKWIPSQPDSDRKFAVHFPGVLREERKDVLVLERWYWSVLSVTARRRSVAEQVIRKTLTRELCPCAGTVKSELSLV